MDSPKCWVKLDASITETYDIISVRPFEPLTINAKKSFFNYEDALAFYGSCMTFSMLVKTKDNEWWAVFYYRP